jgi:hypothetical protein
MWDSAGAAAASGPSSSSSLLLLLLLLLIVVVVGAHEVLFPYFASIHPIYLNSKSAVHRFRSCVSVFGKCVRQTRLESTP